MLSSSVTGAIFAASRDLDVRRLGKDDIRAILPRLVRYVLCKPALPCEPDDRKRTLMKSLLDVAEVNKVVELLSVDFREVDEDCRKLQELRKKTYDVDGSGASNSIGQAAVQEFEHSSASRKMRLVISEVLWCISQVKCSVNSPMARVDSILDIELYALDVSYALCIAAAELPDLLPVCDVVEGLLSSKRGCDLILQLVANSPDSFTEVCKRLIVTSVGGGHNEQRLEVLKSLCSVNDYGMAMVQNYCLQSRLLPQLVLWTFTQDPRQLTADPLAVVTCLAALINRDMHKEDVGDLLGQVRELLLVLLASMTAVQGQLANKDCMVALVVLQLYASLKELSSQFKLTEHECRELLHVMHLLPPDRRLANRWSCFSLCFVIANAQHFESAHLDKHVVTWLKWLMEQHERLEESGEGSTTVGQLLFLVSIHFHSNQLHAVADLVTSMLDIKSSTVKTSSLAHIKLIFTQDVFTEQVVCQLATKVKVTKNINDNMTSYLPVHCVYQLIRSKAFSKNKAPIKDWIYAQLCEAKLPIHHSLPQLLRVYVNSTLPLTTSTGRHDNLNEPITEEEIGRFFNSQEGNRASRQNDCTGDGGSFAPQLLMLTYVLLHQDAVNSHWKHLSSSGKKPFLYSSQLLSKIPMKALLLKCRSLQTSCAGLFAITLRLVVALYPHLCLAESWLPDSAWAHDDRCSLTTARLLSQHAHDLSDMCHAASNMTTQICWHARLCTAASARRTLVPSDDTVETVMQALNVVHRLQSSRSEGQVQHAVARKLADALKNLWFKCSEKLPRRLYISTINAMRQWSDSGSFQVTEDDVFADPLLLMQCSKAMLRCPPLLEIVLKLLECYLVASENFYESVAKRSYAPEAETTEIKYATLAAQESAAVQLLLEECLPQVDEETCLLSDQQEIQSIVCSFVHRIFIRNPNIAKLVHFQGYDRRLIPVAVAGIPSAHICVDFIPELLSQPDINKQTFAVELTSMLCQHYPLPRTLSVARLCINTIMTLMSVLPIDYVVRHIVPLLPAMATMCRTMQPLAEDWIEFLGRICSVVFSYRGSFTMHETGALSKVSAAKDALFSGRR